MSGVSQVVYLKTLGKVNDVAYLKHLPAWPMQVQ
jgi:hypothetical protein